MSGLSHPARHTKTHLYTNSIARFRSQSKPTIISATAHHECVWVNRRAFCVRKHTQSAHKQNIYSDVVAPLLFCHIFVDARVLTNLCNRVWSVWRIDFFSYPKSIHLVYAVSSQASVFYMCCCLRLMIIADYASRALCEFFFALVIFGYRRAICTVYMWHWIKPTSEPKDRRCGEVYMHDGWLLFVLTSHHYSLGWI